MEMFIIYIIYLLLCVIIFYHLILIWITICLLYQSHKIYEINWNMLPLFRCVLWSNGPLQIPSCQQRTENYSKYMIRFICTILNRITGCLVYTFKRKKRHLDPGNAESIAHLGRHICHTPLPYFPSVNL